MTKDEALRLALDTLKEVRDETFRLLKNGERLYAEDKVWSTIIAIQETLEKKDEQRTWVGLKDDDEIPWDGVDAKSFAKAIEAKLKELNT